MQLPKTQEELEQIPICGEIALFVGDEDGTVFDHAGAAWLVGWAGGVRYRRTCAPG